MNLQLRGKVVQLVNNYDTIKTILNTKLPDGNTVKDAILNQIL